MNTHTPKTVTEGFGLLAEGISNQIETVNKNFNTLEAEELYDIRGSKVYRRSSQRRRLNFHLEEAELDILIRSMHLLVCAHDNMPGVWVRFSERRLQEVIFAFVELLNSSIHVDVGIRGKHVSLKFRKCVNCVKRLLKSM